jgi:hypothetical protein
MSALIKLTDWGRSAADCLFPKRTLAVLLHTDMPSSHVAITVNWQTKNKGRDSRRTLCFASALPPGESSNCSSRLVVARPHQVHPRFGARTTADLESSIRFITCLAWESTPAEALKLIKLSAHIAKTLAVGLPHTDSAQANPPQAQTRFSARARRIRPSPVYRWRSDRAPPRKYPTARPVST